MPARRFPRWTVSLGVVAVLIAALVLLFDWNWFKPIVEARAAKILNRPIHIANLHVALWPRPFFPRVTFDEIRIPNPDGFPQDSDFGTIGQLAVVVDVERLLHGTLRIDELVIDKPQARMLDNAKGERNWDFSNHDDKAQVASSSELPEIGVLVIRDGDVTMRDKKLGADVKIKLRTEERPGKPAQIVIDGNGRYTDEPFGLSFRGETLLSLRDQDQPYDFQLKSQIGQSVLMIKGDVTRPLGKAGYKADLEIAGPSLSKLFPVLGVPAPPTPPFRLKGALEYEGKDFRFTNFQGKVGESDLAGNLLFKAGDRRPYVEADIKSEKVILADLRGLIGALPGRPKNESAPPKPNAAKVAPNPAGGTKPQGAPVAKSDEGNQPFVTRPGKMLPDMPIDLKQLRAVDAKVTYRGKRVISEDLPIDDLAIDMVLKDARMQIKPVKFGIGGGTLTLNLDLNGSRDPAAEVLDVDFREVDLHRLMKQTGMFEGFGKFGGRASLRMTGNSVAQMLAHSDGQLALVMGGGSFSALLMRLAELDVLKSLGIVIGDKDKQMPIRCMVAEMPIQTGIMKAKTFVLDLADDVITGEGAIDLREEKFELEFMPHPKSASIGVFRAPLKVTGTFANPDVMPDPVVVGAKAAVAAALGVVLTPLGALIPTIELGLGKDSDCTGLIQQAQKSVPAPQANKPTPPQPNKNLPPQQAQKPAPGPRAQPQQSQR